MRVEPPIYLGHGQGQMQGLIPKALNPFKKSKGYKEKDVAAAAAAMIAAQASQPQAMDPNRVLLLGLGAAGLILLLSGPKRR